MRVKRVHHWAGNGNTGSSHITLRAVKAGWRVRCAGRARCGWYATHLFYTTARWAAVAHGAAHLFGWDETPSVGYAALLFPGVGGRMRVLDQGGITDAPWPQPTRANAF